VRAGHWLFEAQRSRRESSEGKFPPTIFAVVDNDSKFCVACFGCAGLPVELRHAIRLGMRIFPSLMVSLTFVFFGQVAIAETLELDRESFCANVDNLQLAQANLLGALTGHHMGIAIVEDTSDNAREKLLASIEQTISIARDLSDSTKPFLDLCATD